MSNDSNGKSRSNKRSMAFVFLVGGLALVIIVFFEGLSYLDLGASKGQMDEAKRYMDSLTDQEIQAWILRTQTILKEDAPGGFTNWDAPPDLKRLGITGIDESTNEVDYVWFGGMDNTALDVVLTSNGNFQVFAVYTPYTNRMIWPKR